MRINNFNFFITDADHVGQFKDKGITHWFTFNQPKSSYELDLKQFGDIEVFSYIFHDAFDKNVHPSVLVFPAVEDVMSIVKHANDIKKQIDNGEKVTVLFNCAAGISRSTAAAYIVLNVIYGEWNERACWEEIRYRRPIARPNPLMVNIADDHLNRGFKMIAPIKNCVDFSRQGNDDCLLF